MDLGKTDILLVLVASVLFVLLISLAMGTRGGRYRALPGWGVFWILFGALLVVLGRVTPWVSLPLLGAVMFLSIREYSFLAPLRRQDRWATLLIYVSIPGFLYPVFIDNYGGFLATILLYLFLFLPSILSLGAPQEGLLDSLGRVMLGVLVFVFSTAHLGFLIHMPLGSLEWFGILVLASELPQRLTGRLRFRKGVLRSLVGTLFSFALAAGAGAWLGPTFGISAAMGGIGGAMVALAVTAGGVVTEAVARDLALSPSAARVGRAALLDRLTPVVYAAPLFYHFLDYLAFG